MVITRSQWGAQAPDFSSSNQEGRYDPVTNPNGYALYSELRPGESLASVLDEITIHHVGNRVNKSPFPSVGDIQNEQIASKKYSDIAYHYAIDNNGNIYEGRRLGARGAHVEGANTGKVGIVFLRDFEPGPWFDVDSSDDNPPTQAQIDAVEILVETLDINYGIEAVKGHNDVVTDTECPGSLLEPFIPQLNAIVEQNPTSGQFA